MVSSWEIAIKYVLGTLPLPEPPDRFIPRQRERLAVESLPLDEESALHLARLPQLHRDPFDRILVCQAIVGGMILVTPDALVFAISRSDRLVVRLRFLGYCLAVVVAVTFRIASTWPPMRTMLQ